MFLSGSSLIDDCRTQSNRDRSLDRLLSTLHKIKLRLLADVLYYTLAIVSLFVSCCTVTVAPTGDFLSYFTSILVVTSLAGDGR